MSVVGHLDDAVQLLDSVEWELSQALEEARNSGAKPAPIPQLCERVDRVKRAVMRELIAREGRH